MRLSIFNENDKVLLLGEGNFSFTTALRKHNLNIHITSTCYEESALNEEAIENISYLKNHGVTVFLGVDATKLSEYVPLKFARFDKILFNFPHVCRKMRLDLNRILLRDFFISSSSFLEENGCILATLCNGQGGTLHDNPRRRWDDSWKISEMAAYGNFVLMSVEKFVIDNFEDYKSTGFRGLDKKFHASHALTHVFRKVTLSLPSDLIPKSIINDSFELTESSKLLKWYEIINRNGNSTTTIPSFPNFSFDLTFTTTSKFNENSFFLFLYNNFGRIISNVEFLRFYKFPNSDRIARTYRISYQSDELPLYRHRVIQIHEKIIPSILSEKFNVKTASLDK